MNSKNHPITTLTEENFHGETHRDDLPMVVDFWAPWCDPCQDFAPVLENFAKEQRGRSARFRIAKVNIDEAPNIAKRYGILSLPNLLVLQNGHVVGQRRGVITKSDLLAFLPLRAS